MPKQEDKKQDCIFCRIIAGEVKADIVSDEDNFIVMNDAHPAADGHCLVIPKKHYETFFDMPSSLGTEMAQIIKNQGLRLIKEKKAEGIKLVSNNYGAAGQVVKHLHIHIIPEKKDVKRKVHV